MRAGALEDPPIEAIEPSRSPATPARVTVCGSTSQAAGRRRAAAGGDGLGRHRHLEGGDASADGGAAALRGFAVLLIDMPGVGESPVLASVDAERQWTPIFEWLRTRPISTPRAARRSAARSAATGR